jgi:hypothetical protein
LAVKGGYFHFSVHHGQPRNQAVDVAAGERVYAALFAHVVMLLFALICDPVVSGGYPPGCGAPTFGMPPVPLDKSHEADASDGWLP